MHINLFKQFIEPKPRKILFFLAFILFGYLTSYIGGGESPFILPITNESVSSCSDSLVLCQKTILKEFLLFNFILNIIFYYLLSCIIFTGRSILKPTLLKVILLPIIFIIFIKMLYYIAILNGYKPICDPPPYCTVDSFSTWFKYILGLLNIIFLVIFSYIISCFLVFAWNKIKNNKIKNS